MSERIKTVLAEATAERDAIRAQSQPLRDKRDTLQEKLSPIEDEMRDLASQIKEVEGSRLVELDKEIGAFNRALGAKAISVESK